MDTQKTGTLIATLRKEKGMTQQQFAEELGITNKAVSKWETGQGMPDITLLPAIAQLLNVTVDELLNGEKDKKEEPIETPSVSETCNADHLILYNKQKMIGYFKGLALLPALFAILGLILPYFIWQETHDYTGILFGTWFELCSIGIFYLFYRIFKNAASDEIIAARNGYLKFYLPVWCVLPVVFLISLL